MPFILAALLVILLIALASVVLLPIVLLQRYRAGTARRRARPWLAAINAVGIALSIALFLTASALTNIWIPRAFIYACSGVIVGSALGMLGVVLTRWDRTEGALHYTPNRWLVLAISIAVAARIAYGFWRSWETWQSFGGDLAWAASSGIAGSIGAGGAILGYYLVYWIGIRFGARRRLGAP